LHRCDANLENANLITKKVIEMVAGQGKGGRINDGANEIVQTAKLGCSR